MTVQFYTDKAGALMPGKKGISLTAEQVRSPDLTSKNAG
jgi:hypothetical protein